MATLLAIVPVQFLASECTHLPAVQAKEGRAPGAYDAADAKKLVQLAHSINKQAQSKADLDDTILEKLSFTASGTLNPMAAMFGGIVGQEIMKAVSGKFHPLFQWFYYDSVESLPEKALPQSEVAPKVRHIVEDAQCIAFNAVTRTRTLYSDSQYAPGLPMRPGAYSQ